jgi:hypothetical protein
VTAAAQVSRRDVAQQRVDRIRAGLLTLDVDVAAAYHEGDAEALGYGTGAAGWKALCDALFADVTMLRPTPAARLEKVLELRRREMPTRGIGDALGVSDSSICADLKKLRDRGEDLPSNVLSLDGRRRSSTSTRRERPAPAPKPSPAPSKRDQVVALVAAQGDDGMTCLEIENATGWRHGVASSPVSFLASPRCGRLRATGTFRDGYTVYVAGSSAS